MPEMRREYASLERREGERRSGSDRRSNWRSAAMRLDPRSPQFNDLLTELSILSDSETLCDPDSDELCEPCSEIYDALWRAARLPVS